MVSAAATIARDVHALQSCFIPTSFGWNFMRIEVAGVLADCSECRRELESMLLLSLLEHRYPATVPFYRLKTGNIAVRHALSCDDNSLADARFGHQSTNAQRTTTVTHSLRLRECEPQIIVLSLFVRICEGTPKNCGRLLHRHDKLHRHNQRSVR